jgi:sugar phosphate permease
MSTQQTPKKPRLFYGWYIVGASFFAHWLGAGIGVPVFGLFFKPMSSELGWTRAVTTIPLVTRNLVSHFAGPVVGPLVDKFGPRYLMGFGAIIAGIGTMLMYQTNSVWQFFLFYAIIGAIGNAGLSNLVTNTTIAKWFIRKRGRATGIAATGINAGEAIMTPLIALLITAIGWRSTWIVMGLIPWVVIAPTSFLLMRRAPEDMGLRPDGDPPEEEPATTQTVPETGHRTSADEHVWTAGAAFRTPTLWMLIVATNLAAMSVSGVMVHQLPHLTDQGLSEGVAALSLTTYAIFAIPSKLAWGFMAEKFHIRYLAAVSMLGSALGLLILIRADSIGEAIAFGVVYGSTRGAWAVVQSLVWADYFGRHFLGTIRGFVMPLQMIAGIGGPIFAALAFDATKSYQLPFTVFVGTYILGALLVLATRPPVPRTAQAPTPAAAIR